MQTFLVEPYDPLDGFSESMEKLDWKRLGKQRVEAWQILLCLQDSWALSVNKVGHPPGKYPYSSWRWHPAVKMWRGHEILLRRYLRDAMEEWIRRGYNNTMVLPPLRVCVPEIIPPFVLDVDGFIASHRSSLLRKNPDWYKQFGWTETHSEYIWPVR